MATGGRRDDTGDTGDTEEGSLGMGMSGEEAERIPGETAEEPITPSARRWIAANTFAPSWLAGRWRRPIASYLAAIAVELVALAAVVLLVQAVPHFQFPEALLLLALVLDALTWGAAPALLATVVGAALLDLLIVPPVFSFALSRVEDAASVALVLVVGVIVSLVAGQTARTRRAAMDLAQALAGERARLARAEREAAARAGELEAIFEAMTDGVYVNDADGRLARMNGAGRALAALDAPADAPTPTLAGLGGAMTPRDIQGRPLPPERWPVARVLAGEILTDGQTADMLVRTLDGQEREVSVSGAPVRDAAGRIIRAVTVVRDVTAQRRLERRTREALEALLAMARTLAPTPEELERADGRGPSTVHLVGQRLVELTRRVLACDRVGITVVDPRTGRQRPLAVTGLSAEQERLWWRGVEESGASAPQPEPDPALLARFLAGETLTVDMSEPPLRDQPNPFGIRTFLAAPLRVDHTLTGILSLDYGGAEHTYTADEVALAGAVAQFAALALERDRLMREAEETRAAELALREANRRMDEFLSIAAHELRSPLTGIKGNMQLALRRLQRGQDAATAAEMLGRAEGQVNRLSRLIDDLLDVSRIQSGHLEIRVDEADLVEVVRRSVEEQRLAWPARTIDLQAPEGAIPVCADADRLAQVVGNYVTNALKYSPPDQPVDVAVDVRGRDVCVRVRDHGAGLTPEQRRDIWDRYRRARGVDVQDAAGGSGGGLGLGLYISRTIVEGHGGRVGVESAPGDGATFWFTIPLAPIPFT